MQRIPLNRKLLKELNRCDRSFIMTLYYHNLDNEHLQYKGGVEVSNDDLMARQMAMMMETDAIRDAIASSGGVMTVDCETEDMWEQVRITEDYIAQGGPAVIINGAIENDWIMVTFDIMLINEENEIEIYLMSSSSFSGAKGDMKKAMQTAAPLILVAVEKYGERLKKVAMVGQNKGYLTPYPDPETGLITIEADDVLYSFALGMTPEDLEPYLGADNPAYRADALQAQVGANPRWIPEAEMGPQCKERENYPCAFTAYCNAQLDPDHVKFFLESSTDINCLLKHGYTLMSELLDASYDDPSLAHIPSLTNPGKTFSVSEIALRDLRLYEDLLYN